MVQLKLKRRSPDIKMNSATLPTPAVSSLTSMTCSLPTSYVRLRITDCFDHGWDRLIPRWCSPQIPNDSARIRDKPQFVATPVGKNRYCPIPDREAESQDSITLVLCYSEGRVNRERITVCSNSSGDKHSDKNGRTCCRVLVRTFG